jgi:hypothetical protein
VRLLFKNMKKVLTSNAIHTIHVRMIVAASGTELATDVYMNGKKKSKDI